MTASATATTQSPRSPGVAGVAKIVRFNWPWYALALAGNLLAAALLLSGLVPSSLVPLALLALAVGDGWLIASLAVSHWIYDRSPIARGAWLDLVAVDAVREVAILHAGQDEASAFVIRRVPAAHLRVFDFFDPARNTEPSLLRARAVAQGRDADAMPIDWSAIPVEDGAFDLVCVVFAAHEIRRAADRAVFFRECARVLAPGGRLIVVEHLRDGWNAIAYGPGALHFLPARAWTDAFAAAALTVERERRHTPFVHAWHLRRAA